MKKNYTILLALILCLTVILTFFTGCSKSSGSHELIPGTGDSSSGSSNNSSNSNLSELLSLFPSNAGAKWIYNGFAEYGHEMIIDEIAKNSNSTSYFISGKVFDMSGGESKDDFGIKLKYVFNGDTIREVIEKGAKMPHKIKEFDILKLPISKDNIWTQQVIINNKSTQLTARIVFVENEQDTNKKIVKVEYTAPVEEMPNGIYKEVRTFKENSGLVRFENTFDKDIDFNYFLFE